MRTTLNIDDALLEGVTQRFPPGTPKTVVIEESLRLALAKPLLAAESEPGFDRRASIELPSDVGRLVARGILTPAVRTGVPPQSTLPPLPPGQLLRDLASDREDR